MSKSLVVVVVVKDTPEWILWVIYVSLFMLVLGRYPPLGVHDLKVAKGFLCSFLRFMVHPLLNGWTEKCRKVLLDGTYTVFLVSIQVTQCPHPVKKFWYDGIVTTCVLDWTGYIPFPFELTQLIDIAIYIY